MMFLSRIETIVRQAGRELSDLYPSLRGPIETIWALYVGTYGRLVSWKYAFLFARRTEIQPYEIVHVDPDDVEYMVEHSILPSQARSRDVFSKPKFKYAGAVLSGDWDRTTRRFDETSLYRGFEAHFERGVAWSDTDFFEEIVSHIEDGVSMWGCRTRQEFEARCERLDRLYESIEKDGYRSQREILDGRYDDPMGRRTSSPVVRLVYDEVTICIGREGDLLFKDGRNRLAIAKVLGLDSIPVWITVRHERWQRFRETVAANPVICDDVAPRLRAHPDLAEVCEKQADT